jgi:hypothetical protein
MKGLLARPTYELLPHGLGDSAERATAGATSVPRGAGRDLRSSKSPPAEASACQGGLPRGQGENPLFRSPSLNQQPGGKPGPGGALTGTNLGTTTRL